MTVRLILTNFVRPSLELTSPARNDEPLEIEMRGIPPPPPNVSGGEMFAPPPTYAENLVPTSVLSTVSLSGLLIIAGATGLASAGVAGLAAGVELFAAVFLALKA